MSALQYNIYHAIDMIRARLGMFIGESTLKSLATFLAGYRMAMSDLGVEDVSQPAFHGFHDWIARKLGSYESTAGWNNMILAATLGQDLASVNWDDYDRDCTHEQHEASLRRFFALVDEYRQSD